MSSTVLTLAYEFILFGANVLGAVAGFGAGLLSIPFLSQMFDVKEIIMASTMTCILNITIAAANWKHINWKCLIIIAFYMCLGLPIGIRCLKLMSVDTLKCVLGLFMILLGIYGILKLKNQRIEKIRFGKLFLRICLFIGGITQGAISSGGSFILLYAQQEIQDKKQFRATLAFLWTFISMVTVIQYKATGTLTYASVKMFAIGTPAVLLGIYSGGKISTRITQRTFMFLVNWLMIAAGLMNFISVLLFKN